MLTEIAARNEEELSHADRADGEPRLHATELRQQQSHAEHSKKIWSRFLRSRFHIKRILISKEGEEGRNGQSMQVLANGEKHPLWE